MNYDPRRDEIDSVALRLASARRQREGADPGSVEDIEGYTAVTELAAELRDRRRMLGSPDSWSSRPEWDPWS
jgi:hypothetical protein